MYHTYIHILEESADLKSQRIVFSLDLAGIRWRAQFTTCTIGARDGASSWGHGKAKDAWNYDIKVYYIYNIYIYIILCIFIYMVYIYMVYIVYVYIYMFFVLYTSVFHFWSFGHIVVLNPMRIIF